MTTVSPGDGAWRTMGRDQMDKADPFYLARFRLDTSAGTKTVSSSI